MGNFSRDRGLSVAPSNSDHSRGDGKLRRDTREGQDVPAAARNLRHRASAEAMKCSSAYQKPDEPETAKYDQLFLNLDVLEQSSCVWVANC